MAASIPYYTIDDLDNLPDDGNRYELLDGVLLVTPAPALPHQLIVSRLSYALIDAVQKPGHAFVFPVGTVALAPRTQLEPDILVIKAEFPVVEKWLSLKSYWLAVEVYSWSSRIYDRIKRDNYHRLGVVEVWLVDRWERTVEISREIGRSEVVSDAVLWRPAELDVEVRVELSEIFAGIE